MKDWAAVCATVCCIHRSQTCLFQHTSGTSLHPSVHVGTFRLKAGWCRCRKKVRKQKHLCCSWWCWGHWGDVEEYTVLHRRHEEGRFLPVWKLLLQTVHWYIQYLKILMEGCYTALSTLFFVFCFLVISYGWSVLVKATTNLTFSVQQRWAHPRAASAKCQMIQSCVTPKLLHYIRVEQ